MSPTQDRLSPGERALAERLGELRQPEPPAELDARIRAHAHAAVRPRGLRWQWGMGTAAAALLAAVVLHRALETPNMSGAPPSLAPDSLPVLESPQPLPAPFAPADDGPTAGDAAAPRLARPAEATAEEEAASTIMLDEAMPQPEPQAAPLPPGRPAPREATKATGFAEPFPAAPISVTAPPAPAEPAAPAPARPAPEAEATGATRDAQPASAERRVPSVPATDEVRPRQASAKPAAQPKDSRHRSAPSKFVPEPAEQAMPPAAMPAPPAPLPSPATPEPPRDASPQPLGRMQEEPAAAGVTGKSEALSRDAQDEGETLDRIEVTGSRIKRADVEGVPEFTSFDEGIARVRALLEAGRRHEARELLRHLRQQFPRERIPADLRSLLRDGP